MSLSHRLLGLSASMALWEKGDQEGAVRSLPKMRAYPAEPSNCLEAVLQLLKPSGAGGGGGICNLLLRAPELAQRCFELLYHLCASPICGWLTLTLLRRQVSYITSSSSASGVE